MPNLKDGESVEMQGSGSKPYVLKNVGGVYSCSCPAWRNQSVTIEKRTCKHLRAYLGAYLTADGHSEFLMRGNLEYGIHAGPVTVAPSVSVDYVAEEVLFVAGLAIGAGF